MSKEQDLAAYWKRQVNAVEDEYKRWFERGKRISQRYRDEREKIDDERRHFNLFWSNVQTLKPAIYSRVPVPICERRFLDKDPTGRIAATILERALRYEISMCGFDNAIRRARTDYLVPGRGQVWVRYNPQFGESISPKTEPEDEMRDEDENLEGNKEKQVDQVERELVSESLQVDYVHWQDYYQFPAHVRTEEEIEGKGRRLYMSREDLIDRFGARGKKVPLDHIPAAIPDEGSRALATKKEGAQATVYEIWWKPTRTIYFIGKEYDRLLEETDDPLHLDGFFPCPPALQTTTTNEISKNMHEITDTVRETSCTSHETASAAGQLANMAEELRKIVAQFKI